jgi:hypothetical protein
VIAHRKQCRRLPDVERREDPSLELLGERLHVDARLLIEIRDGQVRPQLVKTLSRSRSDRALVRDSDDERVSSVVLPGNTPHCHWAKSGEYVTQVTAIGPLGLEYLDSADDPRQQGRQSGTDSNRPHRTSVRDE